MWRKVLLGIIALTVIVGVFNKEKIERLYHVVSLFDEQNIVHNFSNMQDLMLTERVPIDSAPQAWPEASNPLPKERLKIADVQTIESFLNETETTSLLVLKNGTIVHEEYRLGTGQKDLRISWSMAKSFLSAALGVALEEGRIESVEDPVDQYVPSLAKTPYQGVSIRNVLNMSSGVEFDEDYMDFNSDINRMGRVLALGGSMDEFAHSLEGGSPPGAYWQYCSIDTHVLAMVVRSATGQTLRSYLGDRIWRHLGVEGEAYYLVDGEGVDFALGGLNMQTRDYARFGELFRNGGRWGDKQIISQSWVNESTRSSAPGVGPGSPVTVGYGYQWWVPQNDAFPGEYYAGGIYGQYIYINPAEQIVIVKTSAHRGFRGDGASGNSVRLGTLDLFRTIVRHYRG